MHSKTLLGLGGEEASSIAAGFSSCRLPAGQKPEPVVFRAIINRRQRTMLQYVRDGVAFNFRQYESYRVCTGLIPKFFLNSCLCAATSTVAPSESDRGKKTCTSSLDPWGGWQSYR